MFGIAPPHTDYFMNTLAMILGPIVHHVTGIGGTDHEPDTTTALSILLGYVNTIALFVAVFWVLYIGFVGLLKTTHEGEWLGQKWSTMWVPLRIALAIAFVLPVFPMGHGESYSAVQAAAVWVEANAVGMADKAWSLTNEYIVTDPIGGVRMSRSKVNEMADGILNDEVCMDASNRSLHNPNYGLGLGLTATPITLIKGTQTMTTVGASATADLWNLGANTADNVWNGGTNGDGHPISETYEEDSWGYQTGSTLGNELVNYLPIPAACGSIMYPAKASNLGTGNAIGSSVKKNIDNAVWSISAAQMQELVAGEQTIANDIVGYTPRPSRKAFGKLIHTYDNNVLKYALPAIAAAEKPEAQKMRTAMDKQGFMTAGSWWWQLMHMNATAQDAVNNIGTMTMPSMASFGLGGMNKRAQRRVQKFLASYEESHKSGVDGSPASKVPQPTDLSIAGAMDTIFQGAVGNAGLYMADTHRQENPLLGIESIGTILEVAGSGMYAMEGMGDIDSGAASGLNKIPALGIITKSLSSASKNLLNGPIGDLLMLIATACFGLGLIMTVWIPMLPYIIWTFAMFGLLIFFIEFVFAAPFWAIAHMNPEGHEVVGSGGRGWMLMLQLLLKPLLMVGGLVAGTALLYAGAWVLQHTIGGAILSTFTNSVGGFVGPFDGLAQVIIYCFMLIVFIDMSFGLIHKLPDLVLGWIGGTSTDRGEGEMQSREGKGRSDTKSYGDSLNAISNKRMGKE